MKRISSYFAAVGEKRAKPTATDENQNEAITNHFFLTQTHQQDMVIAQLHKTY